jgi:hypothetical protein
MRNFITSPNIMKVIKTRRMGWAGHVVCMKATRNAYKNYIRKLETRDHPEDLGRDGRMTAEWTLEK